MTTWLPSWDGASYAANNSHHRRHDVDFLATVDIGPAARVLDIGCGSGEFTATLAALVPDGHVVGLDPQPSMIEHAVAVAGPNQSFVLGTAQDVADVVTGPFDAVVSRAALQWVPLADHPRVLAGAAALLAPGGLLRLEAGGGDNIASVLAVLDDISQRHGGPRCPWAFPSAGTYLDLVQAAGFDVDRGWVRLVAQRRPFDRDALVGWLTSQCLIGYEHTMPADARPSFRAEALASVDRMRRQDGTYDVTYVRLDVRAHALRR